MSAGTLDKPTINGVEITPEMIEQMRAMGLVPADAAVSHQPSAVSADTGLKADSRQPTAVSTADKLRAMCAKRSAKAGLLGEADLSQVQSKNYRLLPEETDFEATIISLTIAPAKSSGREQITLGLKTTFPLPHAGVDLTDYVAVEGENLWKFKSLCEACTTEIEVDGQRHEVPLLGPEGRYIGDEDGQAFLGNIVRFRVQHDEYNEKVRNKIKGGYTAGIETPGLRG